MWIGEDLREAIGEWLERRDEEYPETDHLFPDRNGDPVRRSSIAVTIKRVAMEADLPEPRKISLTP